MGSCGPASGRKVKEVLEGPSSHKVVEIQEMRISFTLSLRTNDSLEDVEFEGVLRCNLVSEEVVWLSSANFKAHT